MCGSDAAGDAPRHNYTREITSTRCASQSIGSSLERHETYRHKVAVEVVFGA